VKAICAAGLAAGAMLAAAPAMAQDLTQAQYDEAHCVVLYVPEGLISEDIVLSYIGGGQVTGEAATVLKTAQDTCVAKYGWDADALNYAMTLALAYLSIEWHVDMAEQMEISSGVVNNMQVVANGLTPEEQTDLFLSREGPEVEAKVRRLLVSNGAPNSDASLMVLYALFRDQLIYPTQLERFVKARFP
jgi:hypothetical protein